MLVRSWSGPRWADAADRADGAINNTQIMGISSSGHVGVSNLYIPLSYPFRIRDSTMCTLEVRDMACHPPWTVTDCPSRCQMLAGNDFAVYIMYHLCIKDGTVYAAMLEYFTIDCARDCGTQMPRLR